MRKRELTAGGGMLLGIMFGAALGGHIVLGMVIGLLFGAAAAARRARLTDSN